MHVSVPKTQTSPCPRLIPGCQAHWYGFMLTPPMPAAHRTLFSLNKGSFSIHRSLFLFSNSVDPILLKKVPRNPH